MEYKANLYDKQINFEYTNNDEFNLIKHIEILLYIQKKIVNYARNTKK